MTERAFPPRLAATRLFLFRAALFSLALFFLSSSAEAQRLRSDEHGNSFGPGLERVAARVRSISKVPQNCPRMVVKLTASAPRGTGLPNFDQALLRELERFMEKSEMELMSYFGDGCPGDSGPSDAGMDLTRTFQAHYPGGGFFSILYEVNFSGFGLNRGYQEFKVININPWTGAHATLEDLFVDPPGPRNGLGNLWPFLAKAWCEAHEVRQIPSFYNLPDGPDYCANPGGARLPPRFEGNPAISDLGLAYLTRDGLSIQLHRIDSWALAFGGGSARVGKRDLIKAGFNPALWGD